MATQITHNGPIYHSQMPEPVFPTNESIFQMWLRCNPDGCPGNKVVLQEYQDPDQFLTFQGIRDSAARLAAGLKKVAGLKRGESITIISPSSVTWALCAYAGFWAGIRVAAVSHLATSYELVHYLTISEPTAIFVDIEQEAAVREAIRMSNGAFGDPKVFILSSNIKPETKSPQFPHDFMSSGTEPVFDLTSTDNRKVPAAMIFSSGTSGRPKGVLLSHHNLIAHCLVMRASIPEILNVETTEVFYAPFSHIFGLAAVILSVAFVGVKVVILKRFDFHTYLKAVEETKAVILRMVPPQVLALTKDPFAKNIDLSHVKIIQCSGAALGTETIGALRTMMGPSLTIIQGYGMSEGGVSTLKPINSSLKNGSVGGLIAATKVRIVDDDLKDVGPNEVGEVLFQSPSAFMGYIKNPEANAEAFPFNDRWVRTGDVARIDPQGFMYLVDRKKELIKYKGNQVPPAEIEDVVLTHPAVLDAAVCATWDAVQETEIPVAYVKLKPIVPIGEYKKVLEEIRVFVDSRVAPYKRLRGGVFHLSAIPRNPTGKLLRNQLPARIAMLERAERLKRIAQRPKL